MAKQITDARQAPFVWFDVKLDDAGLSPFAFRLYCHLARRTNGGKSYFFETLSHAAQVCQMSLSTTQRAMRQLEERCFVKLIADPLGYPRTYAITDKAEWDQPPVTQTEGGSVTQTGEVGHTDRRGSVTQTDRRKHMEEREKRKHRRKLLLLLKQQQQQRARAPSLLLLLPRFMIENKSRNIAASPNHTARTPAD